MFCPLCKNKVKNWLQYSSRPNVKCPHCKSAERHRLTALFLNNKKNIYSNFLHIAPEKTLQGLFKEKSKNYICGDLNPKRYSDLNAIYLDATDMPFGNNFIDCIYASHILEHIIEDRKAMSEMYRVLKEGGTLLAMVPQKMSLTKSDEDYTINTPEGRKQKYGQWDHVRYYGLDFSERLKECGFYIEIYYIKGQEKYIEKMKYDEKHLIDIDPDSNTTVGLIPKNNRTKYNLSLLDILYVCTKKTKVNVNL